MHPTTVAAALSNNHFDNRKDLTFHVFLKDPFLSTFQHTFIQHYTASGMSFGVNSWSLNQKLFLFLLAYLLFLKFAGNLVARRTHFHA